MLKYVDKKEIKNSSFQKNIQVSIKENNNNKHKTG